ncbi:MAG: DUF4856 domain-containing protein [Pseudomonadota bacterium]
MKFNNRLSSATIAAAVGIALAGCGGSSSNSSSDDDDDTTFQKPTVYADFPLTLAGATCSDGSTDCSSVSYTGQMARHLLREQAKATIASPTTTGYDVIAEVNNYIQNEMGVIDDTAIIAPASVTGFMFKEMINNELGTGRNLSGKMFDPAKSGDPISGVDAADAGKTLGWPGEKSAGDVVQMWLDFFGHQHNFAGNPAVLPEDSTPDKVDAKYGYDYNQLVPKFLMGAVFYYQSINHYLDENLEPGTQNNDTPYNGDASNRYTGKEHSWDEGFGYWGAAAHYGELTAQENYDINKRNPDALTAADKDGDGLVSLYTEYNSGPAYYAANWDRHGDSNYGPTIMDAFLEGRTIITNAVDDDGNARVLTDAERTELQTLASTIQRNWEMVLAEAVYNYAGSSYNDIAALIAGTETSPYDYYKHWGELKGFMMALQFGGPGSLITKDDFEEIDALIGYGPVMQDGNQVTGTMTVSTPGGDVDSYVLTGGNTLEDYQANLKMVQELLDALYTLQAKRNTIE